MNGPYHAKIAVICSIGMELLVLVSVCLFFDL